MSIETESAGGRLRDMLGALSYSQPVAPTRRAPLPPLHDGAEIPGIVGTALSRPFARRDGFRIGGRQAPRRAPLAVEDAYGSAETTLVHGVSPTARAGAAEERLEMPQWYAVEGDRIRAAGDGSATVPHRPAAGRGPNRRRGRGRGRAGAQGRITAPPTRPVTAVAVVPGVAIRNGEVGVIMEAMKLVHTLTAPIDGVNRAVNGRRGETLSAKTVLIEMEAF